MCGELCQLLGILLTKAARTFVVCQGSRVIGYYSLDVGAVDYAGAPTRARKGLARHPIPVMVLARLAVDIRHQRKRIGRGLLRDACLRTVQAADIAGIRALFVHDKDERARAFDGRFGFEPSPIHPWQLMLVKDIKQKRIFPGIQQVLKANEIMLHIAPPPLRVLAGENICLDLRAF